MHTSLPNCLESFCDTANDQYLYTSTYISHICNDGLVSEDNKKIKVEITKIIRVALGCLRDLTFLSTYSENIRNICADRCCFRVDQF